MNREYRIKRGINRPTIGGYADHRAAPRRPDRRQPKRYQESTNQEDTEPAKDLYGPPPEDWLSEDEIQTESLKKLAQADALRAYSFVRKSITRLGGKWRSITHPGAKFKRLFKVFALTTAVFGVIIISFVIVKRLTIDKEVLGEIDQIGFNTLKPSGDSAQIARTKYDSSLGIATYQDRVGDTTITITQQLLPDDVAGASDGVARLAATFEPEFSVHHLVTDKGLVYLLRPEEGTMERILFSYEGLLILATATQQIDEQQWIDYVNRLQ